jgi:hypothetical protein
MTSDFDVFGTARLLLEQHGDDAEMHAAIQADAHREEGDLDGQRGWLRVIDAIKELRRTEPPPDDTVH